MYHKALKFEFQLKIKRTSRSTNPSYRNTSSNLQASSDKTFPNKDDVTKVGFKGGSMLKVEEKGKINLAHTCFKCNVIDLLANTCPNKRALVFRESEEEFYEEEEEEERIKCAFQKWEESPFKWKLAMESHWLREGFECSSL